jgi:hypothetical protein
MRYCLFEIFFITLPSKSFFDVAKLNKIFIECSETLYILNYFKKFYLVFKIFLMFNLK